MKTELEKIKAKQAEIEQAQSELNQLIKEFEANKGKENGYTWEECFKKEGFFIDVGTNIRFEGKLLVYYGNKIVATNEKVCKSYLAACQLSHIIERLNEDFGGDDKISIYYDCFSQNFKTTAGIIGGLDYLTSYKAFYKLVETNTPLLKQYYGIE